MTALGGMGTIPDFDDRKNPVSNYPPPPPPPPNVHSGPFGDQYTFGAQPDGDIMRPARRASIMLWVLGGLGAALALCTTGGVWLIPADQLSEMFRKGIPPEQQANFANVDIVKIYRVLVTIFGFIQLVVAAILLATASPVRRGGRAGIVTAIVTCVLILIACVVGFVVILGAMAFGGPVLSAVFDILLCGLVGAGAGVATLWLSQAFSASKRLLQQQMMQYWQLQQQQQPQAGYGYGAAMPAAAPLSAQNWLNLPPPPPPPPPSSPPADGTGEGNENLKK